MASSQTIYKNGMKYSANVNSKKQNEVKEKKTKQAKQKLSKNKNTSKNKNKTDKNTTQYMQEKINRDTSASNTKNKKSNNKNSDTSTKLTMRLFGIPYQFTKQVDPRVSSVSKTVGKKFTENILLEAPVCTIIPGEPSYLPGAVKDKKVGFGTALFDAAANSDLSALTQLVDDNEDTLRFYDFKNNYTDYMSYVNILCRTGAAFLELDETIAAGDGKEYSFQKYDWKNYRWNANASNIELDQTARQVGNKIINEFLNAGATISKMTSSFWSSTDTGLNIFSSQGPENGLKDVLTNFNYIQFYIDPDAAPQETLTNSTGESMFKSMLNTGQSYMKEFEFLLNSGGLSNTKRYKDFLANSAQSITDDITGLFRNGSDDGLAGNIGNISGALNRVINLAGNVIKGENIIMPNIYQATKYSKSYSITVHLKTPYGTKLGYYLDIFVPLMHLMALALPKQAGANSYSSPFLVKAYVEGLFSCNLGLVESIQVNKISESWSVDGLPTEVDVTLNIADLYSDLSMSPQTSPGMFLNNSSLIEYIATNCGISLTEPNYDKKFENIFNAWSNAANDIPSTVKSIALESIYNSIAGFTGLTRK